MEEHWSAGVRLTEPVASAFAQEPLTPELLERIQLHGCTLRMELAALVMRGEARLARAALQRAVPLLALPPDEKRADFYKTTLQNWEAPVDPQLIRSLDKNTLSVENLYFQGAFMSRANRAATLAWIQSEHPADPLRPKAEWMLLNSFILEPQHYSITADEPQL